MAVVRVFAQAHVRPHEEVRQLTLERPNRGGNQPVVIVGATTPRVLVVGVGHSEEDDGPHTGLPGLGRLAHQRIDRQLVHARHGCHLAPDPVSGNDEERVHQVVRVQGMFSDQGAPTLCSAQAAGTIGWKHRGCFPEDQVNVACEPSRRSSAHEATDVFDGATL